MTQTTMTITRIEIERLTVISHKPFETVLAALKGAVGKPIWPALAEQIKNAGSFPEFEDAVRAGLGKTGLMIFLELDLGAVLRRESGLDKPQMVRLVIGNPLIMKEMAKHVPDAGSYAPVTVLVDERPDGVHLTYDRMASLLAPYGNANALAVARDLDEKIERLLREAAAS